MRLGDLRGKELIDRAGAEHLGIVYHVDAMLDETTGRLLNLELIARRGWLGSRRVIPWGTVEKVGRELVIVNLELADRGEPGYVTTVRPDPKPPPAESARATAAPAGAQAEKAAEAASAPMPEAAPIAWPWPWPQSPPPRRRRRVAR